MKVSGFTVIRNAAIMGYPVVESIRSLLPLVDEMVVGVGQSEDHTRELIESINDPKIQIFDSYWDPQISGGGLILSQKTNEALLKCQNDWCFYLQADEILHEKDYDKILSIAKKYENQSNVEGLLFHYIHFYGSYHVIATSRKWYRNEIRMIKKSSGAKSYKDAQGFRVDHRKVQVYHTGATIYHYGWVKPPTLMGTKSKLLNRLWHGNQRDHEFNNFQYDKIYGLEKYQGSHPSVMLEKVKSQDWNFDPKRKLSDWKLKDIRLWANTLFEKVFNYRIGEYKPFKLLK